MSRPSPSALAACACFNVRKASRALTQAYDDALRPVGIKATQFSLLAMLAGQGVVGVGSLARALGMDRTTLTRNLAPLERDGLVETVDATDRRRRLIRLTGAGEACFKGAEPRWRAVQEGVVARLGADRFGDLLYALGALSH